MSDPMLKLKDVRARTSLSTATIYRLVERGEFPRQHQISPNRVAWRASDIDAFNASRPPTPTPRAPAR